MQAILSERISNYLPLRDSLEPIAASALPASLFARVGLGLGLTHVGTADGQAQAHVAGRRSGLVFRWG